MWLVITRPVRILSSPHSRVGSRFIDSANDAVFLDESPWIYRGFQDGGV
jgi:hypothetical protein